MSGSNRKSKEEDEGISPLTVGLGLLAGAAAAAGLYAYFSSDNESPQCHTSNNSQPQARIQSSTPRERISSARLTPRVPSRNTCTSNTLTAGERLKQRKGDVCCICLFSLKQGTLITTNCEHQFHFKCLTKWVQRGNARCPMCNAAIDLDDIGSDN